MKRRAVLFAPMLLVACGPVTPQGRAVAPDDPLPRLILTEVNAWRQRRRLGPLRRDARLARAAETHARDIAARDVDVREASAHVGADGSRIGRRADRVGYEYQEIFEIIAGVPSRDNRPELAREIVRTWENSPDHRRAMLERAVVDAGVGVAVNSAILRVDVVYAVMALARTF